MTREEKRKGQFRTTHELLAENTQLPHKNKRKQSSVVAHTIVKVAEHVSK